MGVAAIRFYDVAVSIHVMALVIGLGATFFYPVIWRVAKRRFPDALSSIFQVQDLFGKAVIGPSVALILISGIYLVLEGPYDFGTTFVSVGLPIAIGLFLVGPLYFSPLEARLAELAERDIGASGGGGEITFSDEFERRFAKLLSSATLAQLAVLVAIFVMVVKP